MTEILNHQLLFIHSDIATSFMPDNQKLQANTLRLVTFAFGEYTPLFKKNTMQINYRSAHLNKFLFLIEKNIILKPAPLLFLFYMPVQIKF